MFLPDNSIFTPVKDPNLAPDRTAAAHLSMEQRLNSFDPVEATYTEEEALREASRCLKCPTHWCQKACPAGVPVTDFIAKVRAQDYEGAYRLIRTASTLPEFCSRVCPQYRQCQSNCTRGINSQAIGIGKLERFVVERHYASKNPEPSAPATGKSVAVIGAGPSGLSAAQRLVELGHSVTVYEKSDRSGGLLEYGIPNMKLEKNLPARKVASLEAQGVTFHNGVDVGTDVQPAELLKQYDAVILAVGTGNPRALKLEGAEGVQGICNAVDFLTANTRSVLDGENPVFAKDKDVVVIGGGDTGSDCVGTAVRNGCASVTEIEMLPEHHDRIFIYSPYPAKQAEGKSDYAMEEYQQVFRQDPHRYQTTVKAVQADEAGKLKSVTTVSLKPVYDEHFRLTMEEIPGTEQTLPCQLLIIAAGFLGPQNYVAQAFGVETTARSNFAAEGYRTNVDKVFACGDCRTGQSLVVKAMADGRDCAMAVDKALA